jgi:hypothetical protein
MTNQDNERDDLWELLGKRKSPSVSPFFARNVLREIRAQQETRRAPLAWLFRRWRIAVLATAGIVLLAVGIGIYKPQSPDQTAQPQLASSGDYEVIAHLDELLAYEQNSVWLDTPSE